MRKITWWCLLLMALLVVSCDKDKNGVELIYNVTATAEGKVEFSWFNGGANIDGNAKVFQCNDTVKKVLTADATKDAYDLTKSLESNDAKIQEAANHINNMLTVKGIDGEYHLAIKGYVKYGPMIFEINEEYPKDSIN